MTKKMIMKNIKIENISIGLNQPIFVIAEIGGNFNTVDQGKFLIEMVAETGCDAVKFQTFRAETLTSKKAMFNMENTGVISQWEHFAKYELSEADHRALFKHAEKKGLVAFSTPSHRTDVDMLEKIGVPAHKIGSDDAVNIPFLKYVAGTGKPILLSTGMCTMEEVERSVQAIQEEGNDNIILFHCTTNYPCPPESVNLKSMASMQGNFPFPVGYSDHTLGVNACYAAAVMGAPILEFHFTHDKNADGPDHMLSKDGLETTELVNKIRQLPILMGDGIKQPAETEIVSIKNNRKSIILTKDVKSGEKITADNIDLKRPGYGIACEHYDEVIGKLACRHLSADDPLNWEDID